jgi:hypothetical protein
LVASVVAGAVVVGDVVGALDGDTVVVAVA